MIQLMKSLIQIDIWQDLSWMIQQRSLEPLG